jgi:hypothetical protein
MEEMIKYAMPQIIPGIFNRSPHKRKIALKATEKKGKLQGLKHLRTIPDYSVVLCHARLLYDSKRPSNKSN